MAKFLSRVTAISYNEVSVLRSYVPTNSCHDAVSSCLFLVSSHVNSVVKTQCTIWSDGRSCDVKLVSSPKIARINNFQCIKHVSMLSCTVYTATQSLWKRGNICVWPTEDSQHWLKGQACFILIRTSLFELTRCSIWRMNEYRSLQSNISFLHSILRLLISCSIIKR